MRVEVLGNRAFFYSPNSYLCQGILLMCRSHLLKTRACLSDSFSSRMISSMYVKVSRWKYVLAYSLDSLPVFGEAAHWSLPIVKMYALIVHR